MAVPARARDGARGARAVVRDAEGEPRRPARRLPQRERARVRLDHGRQPRHAAVVGAGREVARHTDGGAARAASGRAARARRRRARVVRRVAAHVAGAPGDGHVRRAVRLRPRTRSRSSSPTSSAIARPTTRPARSATTIGALRVAPDFGAEYARAVASDDNPRALSLPRALAMALRADKQRARVHEGLLLRLDAFADEN